MVCLQGGHVRPLFGLRDNNPATDPAADHTGTYHVGPHGLANPVAWGLCGQVAVLWRQRRGILDFTIVSPMYLAS